MLKCPRELILHICQFLGKEYISKYDLEDMEDDMNYDIDVVKYNNLKQLTDGKFYYPVQNLYATCKSFEWMNQLEYICIDQDEFYHTISIRDINNIYHGMTYVGTKYCDIMGYRNYVHGVTKNVNQLYISSFNFYRKINGVDYKSIKNCNSWLGKCFNCKECQQLKHIQTQVFTNDPHLENIFKNRYNNQIIIRERSIYKKELTIDYCINHLVLYKN